MTDRTPLWQTAFESDIKAALRQDRSFRREKRESVAEDAVSGLFFSEDDFSEVVTGFRAAAESYEAACRTEGRAKGLANLFFEYAAFCWACSDTGILPYTSDLSLDYDALINSGLELDPQNRNLLFLRNYIDLFFGKVFKKEEILPLIDEKDPICYARYLYWQVSNCESDIEDLLPLHIHCQEEPTMFHRYIDSVMTSNAYTFSKREAGQAIRCPSGPDFYRFGIEFQITKILESNREWIYGTFLLAINGTKLGDPEDLAVLDSCRGWLEDWLRNGTHFETAQYAQTPLDVIAEQLRHENQIADIACRKKLASADLRKMYDDLPLPIDFFGNTSLASWGMSSFDKTYLLGIEVPPDSIRFVYQQENGPLRESVLPVSLVKGTIADFLEKFDAELARQKKMQ